MEEIWKDIAGYEGLYQVSNLGRVKSRGNDKSRKEKILKPANRTGYLGVHLYQDGNRKRYLIHRLVLMTFKPVEGMGMLEVNHIDENKENNRLDNLEWCTREYNNNYGTRNKRISESLKGENHPMYGKLGVKCHYSIPIVQLTLDGQLVEVYGSSCEAERNGFNNSNINRCIKGKRKTHGGYKWMYLYEYISNMHPNIKKINLFGKEYEVNC